VINESKCLTPQHAFGKLLEEQKFRDLSKINHNIKLSDIYDPTKDKKYRNPFIKSIPEFHNLKSTIRYYTKEIEYLLKNRIYRILCKSVLNNDILIHELRKSLPEFVIYITLEKCIHVNGIQYRYDIYGILHTKTNNLIYEFAIETDEKHHDRKNIQKLDSIKNHYSYINGISLLRIRVNKYNDQVKDSVINFLLKIHNEEIPQFIVETQHVTKYNWYKQYISYDDDFKEKNCSTLEEINKKHIFVCDIQDEVNALIDRCISDRTKSL
jgi:hypothetical protein